MAKTRLILLAGRSRAGKDTIVKLLNESLGLTQVCSHTTRPKRISETQGVEHYFDTKEQFDEIMNTKQVVAYTKIEDKKSGAEGYEYCATIEDLYNADLYIIDPKGIKYLQEQNLDIHFYIVYVHADYEIRKQRAIASGSGLAEFEARDLNETTQFDEFEASEGYDFIIHNNTEDIEDIRKQLEKIF